MFFLPAQQCPVINVDNNVQVNGDPEEATFGNVVRFSCKSNTEILFGPTEIYCDESGSWSGEAPKCKGKAFIKQNENSETQELLIFRKESMRIGKGKENNTDMHKTLYQLPVYNHRATNE